MEGLLPPEMAAELGSRLAERSAALRAEYDELMDAEADLLAALEVSGAELLAIQTEMELLEAEVAVAEQRLLLAEAELRDAEAREETARERLRIARQRVARAERKLKRQAVTAYIAGGTGAASAAGLLELESGRDASLYRRYAGAALETQGRVLVEYEDLLGEARRLKDEAEEALRDARQVRDRVRSQRDELRKRQEAHGRRREEAALIEVAQRELIARVQARRAEYEQRLAELASASLELEAELARIQQGQVLPSDLQGILARPVEGPVVSGFGLRVHPIYQTLRLHRGVDFDAAHGDPVRAAGPGVVVAAGWRGGYGNAVVVDHGNGISTLYAHLSETSVKPGDLVDRGTVVGKVGSTGLSTGPHLHFEVRIYGRPVDPTPLLA
ncbi:MAG: hypothetical protein KatS3mg008_2073 [Acidimicrobiales bacterium]|nr:MAG: hypothetical protein KatS3mg008_2073 [Acidimicrobiales bacterium]